MVVEIRTLRVSADMDAAKYVAGAQAVQTANRGMVSSNREASATATEVETKITVAGNATERLSRKYIDGYASAQQMNSAILSLGRALDTGNMSATTAGAVLDGIYRKYGMVADSSHLAANGNRNLATAVDQATERFLRQKTAIDQVSISQARLQQAGQNFSADLNARLIRGPSTNSAQSSASVFAADFARQDEIANLRAQQSGQNFASDLNARLGVGVTGSSARSSAAVFEEAAREAERYAQKAEVLRAQLNPVGAMQRLLNDELAEYSVLAARGAISTAELAQAQALAQSRFERRVANQNGVGGRNFAATNAMFQIHDIGMTAAMGMDPRMIGLQQGSQLAGAYAGMGLKEAASTTMTAVTGLMNPVSIAAIGLTTLAAAAIQFGSSMMTSADATVKVDDVLEKHGAVLKRLQERYGALIDQARGYQTESARILQFETGSDIRGLRNASTVSGRDFFNEAGLIRSFVRGGGDLAVSGEYAAFADALKKLREEAKAGRPDFEAFYDSLYKTAETDPEYAKKADELSKLVAQYREATKALEEAERVQRSIEAHQRGFLVNGVEQDAYYSYLDQQRLNLRNMQAGFDAETAGLGARSPQELASAARAREEAQTIAGETAPVRAMRIELAAALALARAEQQLADAREQRDRSRQRSLADAQFELTLIGKTSTEAAALRQQYQQISELKEQAARGHTLVDQSEIDQIKAATEELAKLADALARAKLNSDLDWEFEQAGRTSSQQSIANRLRGAGQPIDFASDEATRMLLLQQRMQVREAVDGFFSDFGRTFLQNGGDLGEAFGQAVTNAALNVAQKAWDKFADLMSTVITNALFGSSGGAASGQAATGGILMKAITGGAIKASNDNAAPSLASGVVGQALTTGGNYRGSGVDARLTDILNTAAQKFPGYGVQAISGYRAGDPRFHGKGLATDVQLTDLATGKVLPNYQDAGAFRTYEQFAQTARMVQMEKYPELADKFRWGGYFSGDKGKYGALDTMHFDLAGAGMGGGSWSGGLTSSQASLWPGVQSQGMAATKALQGLAANTNVASKGLGVFGNGLGSIGNTLTSGAGSAVSGGGGGLFGWLGNLFGGGAGSSQWNLAKSGAITGLFADGTEFAPGGRAIVGERGREIVNLPRGSQVVPNHRTESMIAANRNGGSQNTSSQGGTLQVVIQGASGDPHVRELVRQGVAEALTQQAEANRRGGFGSMQARFSNQKG